MPDLRYEQAIQEQWGVVSIAGLDEAGRGAIAGPVVAGAVVLPLDNSQAIANLDGVNDSKQLSSRQREHFFQIIADNAAAYGIGSSSAREIDELGIIGATVLAMTRAMRQIKPDPQYLLLDGRIRMANVNLPQRSIVRGDSASLTIAAASILAKVFRDRWMISRHTDYPQYGFDRHKGYCTRDHERALATHGPCPIHRYSFAPIRRPML